jgi:dTDP-4-amino-4,6-dideoxygalactose transaminase
VLKPVLVDVDPVTMNIDPATIEVGPRTRAILAVHLFGRPCRMEELPDLPVIEDAAGALGARRAGEACGSLGLAACLSFHPRKIVNTGEGGAITTSEERIAAEIVRLRNHGWRSLAAGDMPEPGLNYRMSDILAAVGLPQLHRLDELLGERTRIADAYNERLRHLPVVLPSADEGDVHGWQVRDPGRRRGRLLDGLRRRHRGADRDLRAAAAAPLPRPGLLRGRRACLRARTGTSAPHSSDRARVGSGRGSARETRGLTFL